MPKFPVDAPKAKVVKALELLGFTKVRQGEHISMVRENDERDEYAVDDAEPSANQGLHATSDLHAVWYHEK